MQTVPSVTKGVYGGGSSRYLVPLDGTSTGNRGNQAAYDLHLVIGLRACAFRPGALATTAGRLRAAVAEAVAVSPQPRACGGCPLTDFVLFATL